MTLEQDTNHIEPAEQATFEYVMRVTRVMAETRELTPLLSYVMKEVLNFVGAEKGYLVLINQQSNDFEIKLYHEKGDEPTEDEVTDEMSHTVLQETIETGKPIILGNAMLDPRFSTAHSVMYHRLRSVMCSPLVSRNRIIGAIYVENRSIQNRFKEADLAPLILFANQTAVYIENAQLNENLAKANEHLRKLDEAKTKLLTIVSHELRTPLTAVIGYAQMIEAIDPPDVKRMLNKAIDRMWYTTEEIVTAFRIMSDHLRLFLEPQSLATMIQEIVYELEQTDRDVKFHLKDLDELPSLSLDEVKMKVVFKNIIGNALKYTPDGKNIYITGYASGEQVWVDILDEGIGIPPEAHDKIFDLFHSLGDVKNHSTSKTAFLGSGLGLGLPIAQGIVLAHGGQIEIASPGYNPETCPGTTCRVTLPVS